MRVSEGMEVTCRTTNELSAPANSIEHSTGSARPGVPASSASIVSLRDFGTEYRIWLDVAAGLFAIVSFEDHAWALQWKWQITWDRHKRKAYATRSPGKTTGRRKIYMHKAILVRAMKLPPSDRHTIGDHQDGNSLNCRRDNLEWATPSQNRRSARSPSTPKTVSDIPF